MRAATLSRYGGPEVVSITDQPMPAVGPNDVRIQVKAASVNPLDFKLREGKAKLILPYTLPLTLGNDLSGVVESVGPQVKGFTPGDEVYVRLAKSRIGAFAEYACADASLVAPKPRNLTHEEAASIPLIGLTTWQALLELGNLQPGQRVFIQAGAGGIGSFAIQLAHLKGAHVITTTSPKNAALVRELGADEVIDYTSQRFEDVLKDVELVYDTLGGDALNKSFQVLKKGGMVVSISALPDFATARALNVNVALASVMGLLSLPLAVRAWSHGVHYRYLFMRPDGEQLRLITPLLESGQIKPLIDKVYPLEQTREALAHVESGRSRGKVIVAVR